ncbi:MAG: hypothetical protein FWG51_05095, partial [Firmicutes bacterium]|nr:hypothetical protein [Bacillota bacterium]
NGIFKVRKGTSSDDYVYGAINIYGTEIVAVNKKNTTDIDLLDGGKIVRVLTEYFRVKSDKSLERIADSNNINFSIASGDINNLHIFGDYLYTYSGTISSGVSSLNVYSLKGELLKKFLSESETGTKYFVLNEGNVLKMKNFRVPDDSNDFTYFTASFQKFKVIYELYNVKNNSSKSIDFKYYITYVQCGEASDKEFYSETYSKSNLVRAYEIKDKKYLQANDYLKYLFVNNSLKIEAEQELSTVYMLEENRYLHVSVNGEGSYIKDKSGNTIATIGTNFTPSVTKINSGLIVVAKAVSTTVTKYGAIDFEGNLIVDCEYDELSAFFGGGALGRNGTGSSAERYNVIVNFGIVETTKIDTYTQVGGLANFYRSDNDYFAVNGTELFTASTYNVSYLMSDGSCLFRVDDAKYYYVK